VLHGVSITVTPIPEGPKTTLEMVISSHFRLDLDDRLQLVPLLEEFQSNISELLNDFAPEFENSRS
jgi:hypothetical protein